MHDWQSLSHVRWDYKYHVVIVPKYHKKVMYGKIKTKIGPILRKLCQQRGISLLEGHTMPEHIHMCLTVSAKFSIAHTIGLDEETIRQYIREQDQLKSGQGKLDLK